jgi:hypothetical protein
MGLASATMRPATTTAGLTTATMELTTTTVGLAAATMGLTTATVGLTSTMRLPAAMTLATSAMVTGKYGRGDHDARECEEEDCSTHRRFR